MLRFGFFFLTFCILCLEVKAQVDKVCISAIQIEGSKKTRDIAVLRYLNIEVGDSIPLTGLIEKMEENRVRVINSRLFTSVAIKISKWEDKNIELLIEVKEAWYIYPIPIFELADRNFNVWWNEFNRDISRVNLGGSLYWRNVTGMNDWLAINVQFGYKRKFKLFYRMPALDKKQKWGFDIEANYSDLKEVNYASMNSRQLFYKDLETKDRQFMSAKGALSLYYRANTYENHHLTFSYNMLQISDSIFQRNPDFFISGQKESSFELEYTYIRDKRDISVYPLKGYYFEAWLSKRGLGFDKDVNLLRVGLDIAYYHKFWKRFSLGVSLTGRLSMIRQKEGFYHQNALGFGSNFVRGFQYNIINGQDFILSKLDLNYKIVDFKIPLFVKSKNDYIKNIPIRIHSRLFVDYGKAWDRYYNNTNYLSNVDLVGYGIGIDFAVYNYNILFQFEYTFNNFGSRDLYFKYRFDF